MQYQKIFSQQQGSNNNPNSTGQSSSESRQDSNAANQDQQQGQQESDAYRRDGAHLGGASYGDQSASTQKGGGGSGYDVGREQQEVNKEQEQMHQERDPDQLTPERTQTPRPETDPGRENPLQNPEQNPAQPETRPGTSTMGQSNRNVSSAWSQSSWDPNSLR